ncbi:MAG: Gfo/Idh/MocA family oxidoreductase, partial [Chloroflexota bacterium]|nr:Gfo/Idh/MocA family oxidoreductase [Chloroflexota bacterium]
MTASNVRIAIVGLDHWYSAFPFAESVAARPDATLVAIAEAQEERARELASRVGVDRVVADVSELLADAEIDAVASFINTAHNPSVCVAAARAGKHLLSVKPLARDLGGASQILEAVRASGTVFLPAESRGRLADQAQTLKRWLAEGRLGQP